MQFRRAKEMCYFSFFVIFAFILPYIMNQSIWIATSILLVIPLILIMRSAKWSVKGKHVFITGGSQGLGLSLAELVVEKGADVTICARSQEKLEAAVRQIKKNAHSGQKVSYVVADVSTFESARKALESASSGQDQGKVDRIPDVVFCCAGASKPGYFIEQDESRFAEGIKTIYMTALSTAHATTKLFIANKKWDGKLVLTGSTLSFTGIVGYAQYAPMKWAIRGLAETLRSEFLLYNGLSIHAYFPGTILSPGYIEEEKTKPKVTQSIEDGEKGGQTPLQCAKKLLEGVENNNFIITSDFDTDMLRAATSIGGTIPSDNFVLDRIKSIISLIGVTFWRKFTADSSIRKFAKQNPDQVPGLH